MNAAMFIGVGLGYVAGVLSAVLVSRRLVAAMLRGRPPGERGAVARMALAGGLVALLPALLLGTVAGGTLGAMYGENISRSIGGGGAAAVPGIALGTFAVVAVVMCLAIVLGAYLARFLPRGQDD